MENLTNETVKDQLKHLGIMNDKDSFIAKITPDQVHDFLQGKTLVAHLGDKRIGTRLTDDKNGLEVQLHKLDRNFEDIQRSSKNSTQFYNATDMLAEKGIATTTKAMIYHQKQDRSVEYDMIKDAAFLTKVFLERNNPVESNRYREELDKLRSFLLDKMDEYPEIGKQIQDNINILDEEIDVIRGPQIQKSTVDLDVVDNDIFDDAERNYEENIEQEQSEELPYSRKRR